MQLIGEARLVLTDDLVKAALRRSAANLEKTDLEKTDA
jgi:hypothetical protein